MLMPPEPAFEDLSVVEPQTFGPPHSRESEEAAIGSVLINPDVFIDLRRFLHADDFYIHRLRFIWTAFERLQDRRAPIDSLTVSQELDDMGRLSEIGGPAYLVALFNQVPTTLHAEAYGEIIKALATRRKLLLAADSIANMAHDTNAEIGDVVAKSEQAIFEISEKSIRKAGVSAHEGAMQLIDYVDEMSQNKIPPGFLTGHIDFDALTGGLVPGTSGLIGARPGQGKTALLLSWLAFILKGKNAPTVVYNNMESTPRSLFGRLAAIVGKLDAEKIRFGKLSDEEWPIFNHAIETISQWPLEIIDERDPLALCSEISHRCARGECGLLINDYIGKFEAKADSRVRQVGIASSTLAKISVKMNIPVTTAAQVSRTIDTRGKDSELVLSDLKETGDLEQDANWVLFINPNPQIPNVKSLHLAKNRDGRVGRFDLIFRSCQTKFENASVRKIDLEQESRLPYRDTSGDQDEPE